jgi:aminotransferase
VLRGESDVERMVASYDERRKLIVAGFNSIGLPTYEPHGAFYAFPSITPTGLSSDEFAEKLLYEEQVAVVPGSAFGAAGEGFVRCTYCTARDKLEQAIERMGRFVKRYS